MWLRLGVAVTAAAATFQFRHKIQERLQLGEPGDNEENADQRKGEVPNSTPKTKRCPIEHPSEEEETTVHEVPSLRKRSLSVDLNNTSPDGHDLYGGVGASLPGESLTPDSQSPDAWASDNQVVGGEWSDDIKVLIGAIDRLQKREGRLHLQAAELDRLRAVLADLEDKEADLAETVNQPDDKDLLKGADSDAKKISEPIDVDLFGNSPLANEEVELWELRQEVERLQENERRLEEELEELRSREEELARREADLDFEMEEVSRLKDQVEEVRRREGLMATQILEVQVLKQKLADSVAREYELQRKLKEGEGGKELMEQLAQVRNALEIFKEREAEVEAREEEIEKRIEAMKALEVELVGLRRQNKELSLEARKLRAQVQELETRANRLAALPEVASSAAKEEEVAALRHACQDLQAQVEGLQMSRFSEVEELVYLRWVNACLRYELRNFKAPEGKFTALDLNKSLSPRSQSKAKELMMEYASPELLAMRAQEQLDSGDFPSHPPSPFSTHSNASSAAGEGGWGAVLLDAPSKKKRGLFSKFKKWGSSKNIQDDTESEGGGSSSAASPDNRVFREGRRLSGDDVAVPRRGERKSFVNAGSLEAILSQQKAEAQEITTYGTREEAAGAKSEAQSRRSSYNAPPRRESTAGAAPTPPPPSTPPPPLDTDALPAVAQSFQLMSKTPSGQTNSIEEKYPPFKKRAEAALARQLGVKEQAALARESKRRTSQGGGGGGGGFAGGGKKRLGGVEVVKREPRKLRPPPPASGIAPAPSGGPAKPPPPPGGGPPPPPPPPPPGPGGKGGPPPPPPPPGGPNAGPKGWKKLQNAVEDGVHRAPEVIAFYQSLMKRDNKAAGFDSPAKEGGSDAARADMIGEIENRSGHMLAVKADVETQGEFVKELATEVRKMNYQKMEDVVAFCDWLDEELSFLVDERAVLKHFDWPESKADAIRESAFEFRDLTKMLQEVEGCQDDPKLPCEASLKRMFTMMEKTESSIYALLRTRDQAVARYKEFGIPTYWIQDQGIVGKIKVASVGLARSYMQRVAHELDHLNADSKSEDEPVREFLLLQGVRFAFRVHQFAGGFDADSMRAFEELRNRASKVVEEGMGE